MRIAVLGGAGLTGQAAVKNLVESRKVSEVVVGDISEKALARLVSKIGDGKVEPIKVDVTDVEATSKVLRGCDVVINAVQYYYNLHVMQASLRARTNYLDLGGLYHVTLQQLQLDSLFKSENLLALIGMGAQPGVTNVIARHACESLDTVDTILIRDGSRDLTENAPPFVVTWSLQTLFDELVMDAIVFEDGSMKKIPPLSRCERVGFPEPVGELDTYVTIHSEIATFPNSFRDKGLRRCDWMEGSPDLPFLKRLVDLGLASNEELKVNDVTVNPRKFLMRLLDERGLVGYPENVTPNDWEATRVIVEGVRLGRRVVKVYDIIFPPSREWGMSCAQIGVGIPSSVAALMMGEGEIRGSGVMPPELCVNPTRFFEEIGRRWIRIFKTSQQTLS